MNGGFFGKIGLLFIFFKKNLIFLPQVSKKISKNYCKSKTIVVY